MLLASFLLSSSESIHPGNVNGKEIRWNFGGLNPEVRDRWTPPRQCVASDAWADMACSSSSSLLASSLSSASASSCKNNNQLIGALSLSTRAPLVHSVALDDFTHSNVSVGINVYSQRPTASVVWSLIYWHAHTDPHAQRGKRFRFDPAPDSFWPLSVAVCRDGDFSAFFALRSAMLRLAGNSTLYIYIHCIILTWCPMLSLCS